MKHDFISQERWDQGYESLPLEIAPPGDPIRTWLEKYVPPGRGSCIELGCFPGRYLAVLGELGYEVHGIDRTPRITPDLRDWMRDEGYRIGEFTCGDVFTHPYGRQYDVVCSFGLIEHFGQWAELVKIHAKLVLNGGLLVLSTPNFRGWFQRVMHEWLDPANLAEHNLEAMLPSRWADVIQPLGFEIVACGYIGPFDFWTATQTRPRSQEFTLKIIRRAKRLGRWLPDNIGIYAPYCALVARKRA